MVRAVAPGATSATSTSAIARLLRLCGQVVQKAGISARLMNKRGRPHFATACPERPGLQGRRSPSTITKSRPGNGGARPRLIERRACAEAVQLGGTACMTGWSWPSLRSSNVKASTFTANGASSSRALREGSNSRPKIVPHAHGVEVEHLHGVEAHAGHVSDEGMVERRVTDVCRRDPSGPVQGCKSRRRGGRGARCPAQRLHHDLGGRSRMRTP